MKNMLEYKGIYILKKFFMSQFGRNHPDVERLQELSNAPINETNAEAFMIFLERAFINNSWEQHEEPRRVVEQYLARLNRINDNWAQEIRNAIRNTNVQIWELRADINPSDLERAARQILDSNIETRNNRNVFLYQTFINQVASLNIWVDGIMGRQTLETIWNNMALTQAFLQALGATREDGSVLPIDGINGIDTSRALQEYLWVSPTDAAGLMVVEQVVQAVEQLQRLTDEELLSRLETVNEWLPRTAQEKRNYITEFSRRFTARHIIVRVDENNVHRLVDHTGASIDIWLSDVDIQAIMLLLSIRDTHVNEDRELLSENIANNIFDSVVAQYDFKNGNRHWRAQDFIVSWTILTQTEVDANKTQCISQINTKIWELEQTLSQAQNDIDRRNIRTQIQRLEIAYMYVRSQNTAFSWDALAIARNIMQDQRAAIQALWGGEGIAEAIRWGTPWEIRNALMANIPNFIIGWIFALLARLLPSPFKEIAYGIIGAIVGIGVFEDLQERWVIPSWNGLPTGTNRPPVISPSLDNITDAMREILTLAPAWLESRHRQRYIDVIQKNNENNNHLERTKLNHTFLFLSQDPIFSEREVSAINTDNPNDSTIWESMSEYSKTQLQSLWVTTSDVIIFLRILKESNSDTADTKMHDLFVVWQVTDMVNILDVTWVQGNEFENENRNINRHLSTLPGVSFWVSETIRWNSLRAEVEEILSRWQAGIISWLQENLATRTNIWSIPTPNLESIDTILSSLQTLFDRETGDNQATIGNIRLQYQSIREKLELEAHTYNYLREAEAIYTLPGRAYRTAEDFIYWVQWFGETIPTDRRETITPESIQVLIERGVTLLATLDTKPELQGQVRESIRNLRLHRVKILDDSSRERILTDTQRQEIIAQADSSLSEVVSAEPEVYMQTVRNLEINLAPLKNTRSTTQEYINMLSSNKSELSTLQRLTRINSWNTEFEALTDRVYWEMFTNGIAQNLRNHVTSQTTLLTNFTVRDTADIPSLEARESELNTIAWQLIARPFGTDILSYFGISESFELTYEWETHMNLVALSSSILGRIDSSQTMIVFDTNILLTKRQELQAERNRLESEYTIVLPILSDTDLQDITKIQEYVAAVNAENTRILGLSVRRDERMNELRAQVSSTIDRFTTQLRWAPDTIDAITPIVSQYELLVTNSLWNARNESFVNLLREKYNLIENQEYVLMLQNTPLDQLDESTRSIIAWYYNQFNWRYSLLNTTIQYLNNNTTTLASVIEIFDIVLEMSQWELWTRISQDQPEITNQNLQTTLRDPTRATKESLERALRGWTLRSWLERQHRSFFLQVTQIIW